MCRVLVPEDVEEHPLFNAYYEEVDVDIITESFVEEMTAEEVASMIRFMDRSFVISYVVSSVFVLHCFYIVILLLFCYVFCAG